MRVRARTLGVITSLCITLICAMQLSADPMVVNGDFESDTAGFVVWPGYVGEDNPADIAGWTGEGGRGINPIASPHENPAPFRDNGNNDTHVAFLQGAAHLEQTVSGFEIGQDYVLGLDFNARNCCGDFPIGTILLNGQVVGSSVDLFPDPGAITPVGGTEPWYHADIGFTADVSDVTIRIEAAAAAGGDATMLLDNVTIGLVPEPSSGILLLLGVFGFATRLRRKS